MSARQFEGINHAELYGRFRLSYTDEVYQCIREYCSRTGSSGLKSAVDVGCGNGQSTLNLANIFEHVIGCDVSENQIREARKKYPNIDFRVSPGEKLEFLQDSSVDLVTIAQALHWLDRDAFYSEVTRVLKPGGSLVVYGYGMFEIVGQTEAQNITWKFYDETLDIYWHEAARDTVRLYRGYELPYEGWERNDSLYRIKEMPVDDIVGFMTSWSAWQNYLEAHPNSTAMQEVSEKLKRIYTEDNVENPVKVKHQFFVMMGKKPKSA